MKSTPYHASYYAHSLTLRHPSDDIQKLTAALGDARVDLNPHQVEALFAFKSPLKKGAILADEVGLGKTIEAGLVIAQKWAEKERRILIICPANIRKQWSVELQEKFFLPSIILENEYFKTHTNSNPFRQQDRIVICSFQLAHKREKELASAGWDLAVIDEAHRLRNVYRPDNKIGSSIKRSLQDVRKILLTATPLQNSTMELFGLVSLIDDYAFGDLESFRCQYCKLVTPASFETLKARLAPLCHRTLRKHVTEYINYTKRVAIVEEFVPHKEETELYELISEYLCRTKIYALPNSQRHLMTLILRKLLVLFNGTNNDPDSRKIYDHWYAVNKNSDRISDSKSANLRAGLTDYFRDEAEIMIATEAAAEGVNLQFCSLVVNYDLPWNPQRIEQRIGRCHRYGQKFDVVVINFLNKMNEADQRVYQLLAEKFQLFDGVFGASDDILGKEGEGVDFEKRIVDIFQRCRTKAQITEAFDALQAEYEEEIDKTFKSTRRKLLENFDAEVHEKLRIDLKKGREYLSKQQELKDIKRIIREKTRLSKSITEPSQILELQKELTTLTKRQRRARAEIFEVEDEIERQRNEMIARIEGIASTLYK